MTGRPSVMVPEVRAEILDRIADGETIRQMCRDEHMPAASTVYLALANDKAFSDQYVREKEAQLERMADEILEISDDGRNDWVERENKDGSTYEAVDHDHISRSKLRVDTRKWLMSKLAPKKYGDKVTQEHTGADGGPVVHRIERVIVDPANPDGEGVPPAT